jgi:hypothetical protein
VEFARDLGHTDLWEESLRRSLERRGKPRRSSVELHSLRPARDLTLDDVLERSAHYSQLRRQAAQRQAMPRPSVALSGLSALAVVAGTTLPKLLGGGGGVHQKHAALIADPTTVATPAAPAFQPPHRSAAPLAPRPKPVESRPVRKSAAKSPVAPARKTSSHASITLTTRQPAARTAASHTSGGVGIAPAPKHQHPVHRTNAPAQPAPAASAIHRTTVSHTSGGTGVGVKTSPHRGAQTVAPPVASGVYVNPLAHARVTPERIDQGVDYSGSGTLTALGAARVTYVGTSGTGWPGAFVEYRLTSGAYAGRYVYYAEGVSPLVRVGQTVQAGQAVATMSGGIEVGWGSGVGTQPLAQAQRQWGSGSDSHNVATPAGRSFSALIASLGGPPGKVEG